MSYLKINGKDTINSHANITIGGRHLSPLHINKAKALYNCGEFEVDYYIVLSSVVGPKASDKIHIDVSAGGPSTHLL